MTFYPSGDKRGKKKPDSVRKHYAVVDTAIVRFYGILNSRTQTDPLPRRRRARIGRVIKNPIFSSSSKTSNDNRNRNHVGRQSNTFRRSDQLCKLISLTTLIWLACIARLLATIRSIINSVEVERQRPGYIFCQFY